MASERDPFFVVYRRRSGSTFLSNLLCGSPEIGVAPESMFLERLWRRSKGAPIRNEAELREAFDTCIYNESRFGAWEIERDDAWDRLAARLPITVADLARWFIDEYCDRQFPGSTIHGMKKGGWYATHIDVLRALFPAAPIVMLLRDGRAVFASCKQARYGASGKPFETNPRNEAFAWQRVVASFDRRREDPRAALVRYEDLISDPGKSLPPLLDLLGASSEADVLDSMLRPQRRFRFDATSAHLHENIGREPMRDRIGAWRSELTPDEIREIEVVAGKTLEEHGYPLVFARRSGQGPRRAWAAVLDVAERARRKLSGLSRRRRGVPPPTRQTLDRKALP